MKISIVTIVYNGVNNIEDCLRSVLSQDFPNIEHIVIDGGSTDGTLGVIERFKHNIAVFKSEPDEGLYDALNKGISAATGDVVGILHSDDLFLHSSVLSSVAQVFEEKNVDVLYGDGIYSKRDDLHVVKRIYHGGRFKRFKLYFGWMPLHTTMFVRNSVYEKHGLYDKDFEIAGDYDVCMRWFKDNSLSKYYLKDYLVNMRIGGRSTVMHLQKKKSAEDLKIINRHHLLGVFTLACKIGRKIPQYISPYFYNKPVSLLERCYQPLKEVVGY
ncbi:MAG TPA: glycosyltransferase family 2 protein [Marinilabiliaceae bacterium]|nr:glycosyltransferase family 2 protein [Marinilabiliaceae bacterium]